MNYLFDASSLINLTNGDLLDAVLRLPERTWFIGSIVFGECEYPDHIRLTIQKVIDSNHLILLDDSSISGTTYLNNLKQFGLGLGETECLTFGMAFDFIICCDDKRARRVISQEIGPNRVTGSLGLLREAVHTGLFTVRDALDGYQRMKAAGGFLPLIDESFFNR